LLQLAFLDVVGVLLLTCDVATIAIEHGNQEIERSANVDVTDVNMPFLMDFRWLNVACAFLAGSHDLAIQTTSGLENSIG
jgi:hypothetical protein